MASVLLNYTPTLNKLFFKVHLFKRTRVESFLSVRLSLHISIDFMEIHSPQLNMFDRLHQYNVFFFSCKDLDFLSWLSDL